MGDYLITTLDDGSQLGTDETGSMHLLDEGKMFKRRAIKNIGAEPYEVCWLVAELNGVRVYRKGQDVIVTTRELYP